MKKRLLYSFIFFILIVILLFFVFFFKNRNLKVNVINSDEFKINKIKFYSSANAISNTTSYQNPEWNIKVYQYTDIAIYLDRINDLSEKNYISSISISNFEILNTQEIYYLNPMEFGKSNLNIDNKINKNGEIKFNVINSDNSENSLDYNIPIFFQDCSNPVTIRLVDYLNNNYKASKDKQLVYNGSLIKEIGKDISDLNNVLSFNIEVVTKDGNIKNKKIEIDIPFKNGERSILDGDFQEEIDENIIF